MMNNSYKLITLLLICLVVFTYLGCAIRDLANIKYGAHERNVIDFWKAKSDKPTPVLVHFHGGGFVKGDKRLSRLQKECLKNGISAVSANYRFVKSKDVTLLEVMHDGARVIQFLRSKAKEWSIDPTRIALSGGSAGGNMSLWLALHDNLADPKSKDSISRFSTRVTCAVAIDAQTSNDVNFIRKNIGGNPGIHRSVPLMYGVDTIKELEKPSTLKMMEEFSAINHATKDDPPIYLSYHVAPDKELLSEKTKTFVSIHSAKFGLLLKEKLALLGIECHVGYPGNRLKESELEFLLRHFKIGTSQVTPPITGGK
ncbi:MAG: alpha/beta hydrolase [Deltaproteobacteria bacterium]|nr:alpha/beta hydrolase [Deltaproteobacteria bacterium]